MPKNIPEGENCHRQKFYGIFTEWQFLQEIWHIHIHLPLNLKKKVKVCHGEQKSMKNLTQFEETVCAKHSYNGAKYNKLWFGKCTCGNPEEKYWQYHKVK